MSLSEKLMARKAVLAVVGLGYVGLPIAVAFAQKGLNVIGFDTNHAKIEMYLSGLDPTKEVGDVQIQQTSVQFTADEQQLQQADFVVVAALPAEKVRWEPSMRKIGSVPFSLQ